MKILLIHQNFPGQYRRLVPALLARGHELRALSQRPDPQILDVPNTCYQLARGNLAGQHPALISVESALLRAEAVAKQCREWRVTAYQPDVILVHSGWGESLFLKDIWPQAKLIGFFEYFYRMQDSEIGFDAEFPVAEDVAYKIRMRNSHLLTSLESCDIGVTPTHYQQARFPPEYQAKLQVIHEGIDTDVVRPSADAWVKIDSSCVLRPGDEVITFVNRNLEPARGYHRFIRALPRILRQRPKAHVILVGGNQHSYGASAQDGKSYKIRFLDEVKGLLDMQRVHFVGKVPYSVFLKILQVSSVHVYLTYPFFLSWSLLEAMSAQCRIVASRTGPVEEVIRDGESGRLVDFFSKDELVDAVCQLLASPQAGAEWGANARAYIQQYYDFRSVCLPRHLQLIEQAEGGI